MQEGIYGPSILVGNRNPQFIRFSGPIMPNAVLIECLLNERVDETIIFAFPTSTL